VTVTFASVQTSGNTTVTTSATGNPPPNGFSAGSPAVYYDLSTTAQFTPPVTVCVDVSGVTFPGTAALFHYVSGAWVNVTTSVSSTAVCGTVSTLSPFAVFGKTSPTPSLSIADASVLEGNGGTTPMTFNVTLSAPSAVAVTVNYATAAGTATAGADYVSTTGQLTFPANSTSRTITVQVIGDTNVEANETFTVTLSTPQNASISRATATGTIVNDDASPASRIHAHGNGSILSATRDQFDFDVASTKGLGKGHLNYADQAAKLHLDSTAITSVTCSGNHVTFTGSGRVNHTMVTFQVDAIDGGKGGHGDSFSIHWNGYSASGSLQSGDIRNSC
jgi:hypothetical protein